MRRLCLAVVAFGVVASAASQEAPEPSRADSALPADTAVPAENAGIDEIIVPGRAPENLRVEIERLEVAVYDRFNALNSNDEFDIHCLQRAPTGSNIPQRTCAPNFVIQSESRASRRMLADGRSSDANNFNRAELNLHMQEKSRELTEEIQRVARQDEQLLRDLARLAELKQIELNEQEPQATP